MSNEINRFFNYLGLNHRASFSDGSVFMTFTVRRGTSSYNFNILKVWLENARSESIVCIMGEYMSLEFLSEVNSNMPEELVLIVHNFFVDFILYFAGTLSTQEEELLLEAPVLFYNLKNC